MTACRGFVLAACVAVAQAGCETGVSPETAAPEVAPLFSQGLEHSATGSGHFVDGSGELRKFAFGAVARAGGRTTGQWQLVAGDADITAHGEILCLRVVGNEAWMGGTMDRNNVGAPFNSVRFRVADHGQGASDPADQISVVLVAVAADPEAVAQDYCDETPANPALNAVEKGNIQVR